MLLFILISQINFSHPHIHYFDWNSVLFCKKQKKTVVVTISLSLFTRNRFAKLQPINFTKNDTDSAFSVRKLFLKGKLFIFCRKIRFRFYFIYFFCFFLRNSLSIHELAISIACFLKEMVIDKSWTHCVFFSFFPPNRKIYYHFLLNDDYLYMWSRSR